MLISVFLIRTVNGVSKLIFTIAIMTCDYVSYLRSSYGFILINVNGVYSDKCQSSVHLIVQSSFGILLNDQTSTSSRAKIAMFDVVHTKSSRDKFSYVRPLFLCWVLCYNNAPRNAWHTLALRAFFGMVWWDLKYILGSILINVKDLFVCSKRTNRAHSVFC